MDLEEELQHIIAGNIHIAAHLMRKIDDGEPQSVQLLKLLHKYTGRAWILGITGSPGVGKSTLADKIISILRSQGKTVGVVTVDPSSPFSGGAILGDRIRMQRHATDKGVFIRSLATRGYFGGLTASTWGIVNVMDAMGKEEILIETVGVGQDEVDIAYMADTTIIILVPGLGDEIQAIKAGILEIGDIFVVNKIDRNGAERIVIELKNMLALRNKVNSNLVYWQPPIIMTCGYDGRGFTSLYEAVISHRQMLLANNKKMFISRRLACARLMLLAIIKNNIMSRLHFFLKEKYNFEKLAKDIILHDRDPYSICDEILDAYNFI